MSMLCNTGCNSVEPSNEKHRNSVWEKQKLIFHSSSHDGECTTPPITSAGDATCETPAVTEISSLLSKVKLKG